MESIKNLIYEVLLLSCGKGCMKVYGPIIIQSLKALEKKLHTSWQQEGKESTKIFIYEVRLLT